VITVIDSLVANCESCSMPQDAKLISVKIDNSIDLVCKPLCETNEEYVFEHCSNHQYEVVAQSYKHTVTINSMDDGGSYRCGCNDSYMYFIIQGNSVVAQKYVPFTFPIALASEIQINFPPIDKPTDYITGECTATGFPPPLLEAGLLPKECPSNTSYFEIDTHTGKVVVTTTLANEKCYNAIAYCKLKECDYSNTHVCPPVESIKLHSLISELLG